MMDTTALPQEIRDGGSVDELSEGVETKFGSRIVVKVC